MAEKVIKTDAEWRELLSEEQYQVTRRKATERPFSGKYNDCKEAGTYHCVCCGTPLFSSEHKFNSGSGWPSYWQPVSQEAVTTTDDYSHLMHRIEALCARCGAHLGHVFDDGPDPTGLRYCINSASLNMVK